MKFFFGDQTQLKGVVFVASFGFDAVWPDELDNVASNLEPYSLDALSQRNLRLELDSFRETCSKIAEKRTVTAGQHGPGWLLVLVNKFDLYWDEQVQARDYYLPGAGSEFAAIAAGLVEQTRPYGYFRYDVLPVALKPQDYVFAPSFKPEIRATCQLPHESGARSRDLVITVLEDFVGQ